jgi:methionine-gamma-lyase
MADKKLGFATVAIHGRKKLGKHETGPPIRALSTPIFMSSTFAFKDADEGAAIFAGEVDGYVYTRIGNPTVAALEHEIAYLEGAEAAAAFASGMAASATTILALARAGDNIVASNTLYGGTHSLFSENMPRVGIEVREVDARDLGNIEKATDDRTKAIFIETPANPTMVVIDIEGCAKIAKARGIDLIVDNTFPTPYYQSPLELGASIVIHSATKYIGGHGDTVAGLAAGSDDFIHSLKAEYLRDWGGCLSPFNAWLLLRGLKTLPVRMDKHSENAMEIAQFLSYHPQIETVMYPGMRTHPQHELAKRQMRGFGGMIAFYVKGGREAGKILMDSVEVCTLAVSLGDVDTLIQHPASMTHSTYSAEDLEKAGIGENLVRISVGLEDVEDIVADLRQALKRIG